MTIENAFSDVAAYPGVNVEELKVLAKLANESETADDFYDALDRVHAALSRIKFEGILALVDDLESEVRTNSDLPEDADLSRDALFPALRRAARAYLGLRDEGEGERSETEQKKAKRGGKREGRPFVVEIDDRGDEFSYRYAIRIFVRGVLESVEFSDVGYLAADLRIARRNARDLRKRREDIRRRDAAYSEPSRSKSARLARNA